MDVGKEIAKALSEYTSDVKEELEDAKKEIAKDTVKHLKSTSPKDTGDYAKGWKAKKVRSAYVIHNKTNYQLTHLLENGHVKRGGGRVSGKPHIRPAEQQAIDEYVERVEAAIRR